MLILCAVLLFDTLHFSDGLFLYVNIYVAFFSGSEPDNDLEREVGENTHRELAIKTGNTGTR
jgi:hypothetical protein